MTNQRNNNQRRRTRKNRQTKRGTGELSAQSVIYRGPMNTASARAERTMKTVVLFENFTITSTAGGIINNVIVSSPGTVANWTDLAAVWDEFRILAIGMSYFPFNRYTKPVVTSATTPNCVPVFGVIDRDNSGALTSIAQATQYESCRMLSVEDPWTINIKMDGVEDAGFIGTGAPGSRFYFKMFGTGYTASAGYGYLLQKYICQFRGIGV